MTARYVADEAALREARCECGHWALRHANAGCLLCDECERPPAAALLASGVVQPREDAVRGAWDEGLAAGVSAPANRALGLGNPTNPYRPTTPGTDRPAAEDGPRNTGTGSAT